MVIILSYTNFLHVAFVSIMVFQTFDRIIFATLTFRETRWYVFTARDPQMVSDHKKFGNHWVTRYVKLARYVKLSVYKHDRSKNAFR